MTEGIDDILSIVQPETPAAGGETGANGVRDGGQPTPENTAGEGAPEESGETGESGESGESGRKAGAGEGDEAQPPKKGGIEKRLGEVTAARREAEREAAYLRGQNETLMKVLAESRGQPPMQPGHLGQLGPGAPGPDVEPRQQDFPGDSDAYVLARARWAVRQELAARDTRAANETQARAQQRALVEKEQRREAFFEAAQAVPGFSEAFHNRLPVTQAMADALYKAPEGPLVGLYLGKKPEEAARIAVIPDPIEQALEIGALSARIAAAKAARRTTTAPDPIEPLSPGASPESFDPANGPRDIKRWMKWDRERRMKRT